MCCVQLSVKYCRLPVFLPGRVVESPTLKHVLSWLYLLLDCKPVVIMRLRISVNHFLRRFLNFVRRVGAEVKLGLGLSKINTVSPIQTI